MGSNNYIPDCQSCIFYDTCCGRDVCNEYYPSTCEAKEEYLENLIYENGQCFYREWNEYIENFYN